MRFFFLVFAFFIATVSAQSLDDAGSVPSDSQLAQLEAIITQTEARNESWQKLLPAAQDEELPEVVGERDLAAIRVSLEQVQADLAGLRGEQAALGQAMEMEKKRSDALNALLQKQSNPLLRGNGDVHGDRAQTEAQLAASQRHSQLLQRQKNALVQAVALAEQFHAALEARYQRFNERYLESSRQAPTAKSRAADLAQLERQLAQLGEQLNSGSLSREARLDRYIELTLVHSQIFLTNSEDELLALEARLQELQFADLTSLSLERIDRIRAELDATLRRFAALQPQIESNRHIVGEQYQLYERQRGTVPGTVAARRKALDAQFQRLTALLESNTTSLKMNLDIADRQYSQLARERLTEQYRFGGDLAALPQRATAIVKAGGTFLGQYAVALQTLYRSLHTLSGTQWLLIAFAATLLPLATLGVIAVLNRLIRRYASQKKLTFAGRLLFFLCKMLKNNLPYLALFQFALVLIHTSGITAPASHMLRLLPAVLLFNTIPYYAARNLISTGLIATPEKRRIIRPTIIYAAVGSLLFSLVLMAGWILDDAVITDAYRWIFALYNLLVGIPVWRATSRSLAYMDGFYQEYSTYRILRPLIRAIPAGILAFGAIGTLGYLNLAWIIAKHLLIFILYALIWVAITAILKDSARRAKRYALRTGRGVFWTQDVINPVHTFLTYGSLLLILRLLQGAYGWDEHTPVIQETLTLLKTPIAKGDNSHFTLLNILLMSILLYIIYRVGGWIKSFSYRWLYNKIADLGIRNSLSVFSQYAAVTLGFFLALRVIGIDLTAFTVFAGALGVGIGFGMQTIANNFISGILLLIERPLRNGDIITVGNYEGTVERIGMRSLTITTFNNESVILPNSDFVTSAFMNWSHQDPITRVLLYLDLGYRHDPGYVKQLLTQTLAQLAEEDHILDSQEHDYGAFAYDYSPRGMTWRIQFHVHMQNHHRLTSRHLVIERIWQTCRAHGIEIAYPKQDVYFPATPDQPARELRDWPELPPPKA